MDVLIVGAGSMGTWFGDAIDARVSFADVDGDAAAAAAERVDGSVADLEGGRTYDVVCLAVPMAHVTGAIAEQADRAERAIVDVSGVMEPALEAMERHAPDLERVSLHPLFAPERAPGSIAVVRDRSGPATDDLLASLAARGNELLETTAADHDEAMETVQAATHAAVLSFALAAESVPDGFETPIYEELRRLARQVTAGTPRVYADIQATFDGADAVADAAADIAAADSEELEALYREAAANWHGGSDADERDADDGETDRDESGGDAA
ncbi:prephenate dehydrogenase/arogenate dehydrogenase family protein [Natrinema sp. 1APR25-10V2]|uniref:prephenate dehydrogenase/arogenate dehydrogenase family protein n=1 Tax=Natrinema sp. 1APR25-10V2 TaxID=2951081 RepID=UPI0028743572|nr:prephenate dehydrogenase/arogenate dehydrogenase family protein [Natrinema sp. 1APR25-10V2]MDS0473991.1 prephenate dehydrogenase/arogenate dehydrogenase family protein [Natrinema sp. 1APR25-10V2]